MLVTLDAHFMLFNCNFNNFPEAVTSCTVTAHLLNYSIKMLEPNLTFSIKTFTVFILFKLL